MARALCFASCFVCERQCSLRDKLRVNPHFGCCYPETAAREPAPSPRMCFVAATCSARVRDRLDTAATAFLHKGRLKTTAVTLGVSGAGSSSPTPSSKPRGRGRFVHWLDKEPTSFDLNFGILPPGACSKMVASIHGTEVPCLRKHNDDADVNFAFAFSLGLQQNFCFSAQPSGKPGLLIQTLRQAGAGDPRQRACPLFAGSRCNAFAVDVVTYAGFLTRCRNISILSQCQQCPVRRKVHCRNVQCKAVRA